jgi:hypothetical protein
MLRKADVPLHLYDDIMQWAFLNKNSIPSHVPPMTRKTLYAQLSRKIYGDAADELKPRHIPTILPSGRHCTISVFNIYSQITQLLLNSNINEWENYFFSPTPEDPFHLNTFSDWATSKFNGIETSIWYKRTKEMVIMDEVNEILIPICLFIDGTVLSLSGSLSLEPVMFSLMIHNRQTRRNHEAWLPLGYIHDPSSIVGRKYTDTTDKYNDYHYMLKLIIHDLSELVHSNEGLVWCFRNVPGESKEVTKKLIFRLAFVIGDTKGHDILCCRMGSHNNTPGLCRDCNMTTQNADNPDIPCKFHKQRDLALLPDNSLKSLSFLRVEHNAFQDVCFGASPYGINCATAIDIIHSILIGLMEYLHNTFIDQLTGKQQQELSNVVSYIATFGSRYIHGFPRMDHFKKGLFKKGIMTAKMRLARCFLVFLSLKTKNFQLFLRNKPGKLPSAVTKKMKKIKKENNDTEEREDTSDVQSDCDHMSDDEYSADIEKNSSDWENGISEISEQSYSEESDDDADMIPILDFFPEFISDDDSTYNPFDDYDAKDPIIFTENVLTNWTELYESTLVLYRWLTDEEMPCIHFRHGSLSIAKHALEQFMKKYREVAYRFEGMGLKITKFHQLRHWYFYIAMYGVPTNFDSSFCESHHIHLTKRTGRRTQRRQDELARQTSQRVYEGSVLQAAVARCNFYGNIKPRKRKFVDRSVGLEGSRFAINFDYSSIDIKFQNDKYGSSLLHDLYNEHPEVHFTWKRKRNIGKRPFPSIILQSITAKLSWLNNGEINRRIKTIEGSTELHLPIVGETVNRSCVRAHPDYRETGLWMDWVDICWESEDLDDDGIIIPAQVLMILDFDSIIFEKIPHTIAHLIPTNISAHRNDMIEEQRNGIHLLVHSAADNYVSENDIKSDALVERFVMEPFFQLVELDNVERVVYVARDLNTEDQDPMRYEISKVLNPQLWGLHFIPRFGTSYMEPDDDDLHRDEFNETYNPW